MRGRHWWPLLFSVALLASGCDKPEPEVAVQGPSTARPAGPEHAGPGHERETARPAPPIVEVDYTGWSETEQWKNLCKHLDDREPLASPGRLEGIGAERVDMWRTRAEELLAKVDELPPSVMPPEVAAVARAAVLERFGRFQEQVRKEDLIRRARCEGYEVFLTGRIRMLKQLRGAGKVDEWLFALVIRDLEDNLVFGIKATDDKWPRSCRDCPSRWLRRLSL